MPKKTTPAKKPVKNLKANKNSLLVKIIEDNTDSLTESLGITEENSDRLIKDMNRVYRSNSTVSDTMAEMSKHCKHANELIWVGFTLGTHAARHHEPRDRAEVIHINGGKMPDGLGTIIEEILKKHRDKNNPNPGAED